MRSNITCARENLLTTAAIHDDRESNSVKKDMNARACLSMQTASRIFGHFLDDALTAFLSMIA